MTESEYMRKLRTIQGTYESNGHYEKAQAELEALAAKYKERRTFFVCDGASTEVRKYVAQRFIRDGLDAEVYDDVHIYYNGDEAQISSVRVKLPKLV